MIDKSFLIHRPYLSKHYQRITMLTRWRKNKGKIKLRIGYLISMSGHRGDQEHISHFFDNQYRSAIFFFSAHFISYIHSRICPPYLTLINKSFWSVFGNTGTLLQFLFFHTPSFKILLEKRILVLSVFCFLKISKIDHGKIKDKL